MSNEAKKTRVPGSVTLYTKQLASLNTRREALVGKIGVMQREVDGLDATITATRAMLPQDPEKADAAS